MVVMVMVITSGVVSIKSARILETIMFGTPFDFNQKKN